MQPDAKILVFWILSFKPVFSLSFMFIKRLFSSSLLFANRMVLSAYLKLLIFLPEILIPAYDSSSPAFLMMHSAYKLNKQGDNVQPWRTPFPILSQSIVPCLVLIVASWPAYRRQVKYSMVTILNAAVPHIWKLLRQYILNDPTTKKKWKLCDMLVLANAVVVITLQCILVSNQNTIHLKHT